jgi:exodeoxyribonuclease VII large subunit
MTDLFDLPFEGAPQAPGPVVPARRVYTVTSLTAAIRDLIEEKFFEVWVEGELSGCRVWNTGHLYFTLRDSSAQIKAVMFRAALRALPFKPEDGMRVRARGRVGVYEPKGEYQIVCEHLEPQGLGALQAAFEQLKRKLQAEGLFEQARKRPLPVLPRKIGIVTSLEGAALRDIIHVVSRRHSNVHLVIRPARVQGDGAAAEIAQAVRDLSRADGIDVLIVGRGGGSLEDLQAFNQEPVARAIAHATVPVISAVGHEVDYTIADFVADVRAPTPSAAAEIVVARKEEFCVGIDRLRDRLHAAAHRGVARRRTHVAAIAARRGLAGFGARVALRTRYAAELTHALEHAARERLTERERRLRALAARLEARDAARVLSAVRGRLAAVERRLGGAALRRHHRADGRLRSLAGRLENLSPLAVLARGYAVCWNADRTAILRDAAAVAPRETVRVTLAHGELACEVTGIDQSGARDGREH